MGQRQPVARRDGLAMEEVRGEVLLYDLDRDKAYCLNRTAAVVWKHCDGRTSPARMAKLVAQELDAPVDEKIIWCALEQLGKDRLLERRAAPPAELAGMSRREHLRALGRVAAVAVPLVTAMLAPQVSQAASGCCSPSCPTVTSCVHRNKSCPGAPCGGNGDCCSGSCSGTPKVCA